MPGEMDQFRDLYGHEFSDDVFDAYMKGIFYTGLEPHQDDEANCCVIKNNDYSKHGIQQLRDFLEIEGDFEYDPKKIEDV